MATFGAVASAMPNVLYDAAAVDRNVQAFQRNQLMIQNGQQDAQDRTRLREIGPGLASGDEAARSALYGIDPKLGASVDTARATQGLRALQQDEAEHQAVVRMAQGIMALPAEQRAGEYQRQVGTYQSRGMLRNAPATYTGDAMMQSVIQSGMSPQQLYTRQREEQDSAQLRGLLGMPTGATPASLSVPNPQTPGSAPQAAPTGEAAQATQAVLARLGQGSAEMREYLRTGPANLDPQTAAWCAATINTALAQAGVKGTGSNVATSFANYGTAAPAGQVAQGDVLVLSRGRAPGQTGGHVGFATGNTRDQNGQQQIEMVSGNEGNRVARSWYPANEVSVRRQGPTGQAGGTASAPVSNASPMAQGEPMVDTPGPGFRPSARAAGSSPSLGGYGPGGEDDLAASYASGGMSGPPQPRTPLEGLTGTRGPIGTANVLMSGGVPLPGATRPNALAPQAVASTISGPSAPTDPAAPGTAPQAAGGGLLDGLRPEQRQTVQALVLSRAKPADVLAQVAAMRSQNEVREENRRRDERDFGFREQQSREQRDLREVPTGYRRKADGSGLEPIPGGPSDPEVARQAAALRRSGTPIPAHIQRADNDEIEGITTGSNIAADVAQLRREIQGGQIPLSWWGNLASRGQNAVGLSTEDSRRFAALQATIERIRNDSLRLNKGVQTEGDAQRAGAELVANLNDPKNVAEQLGRLEAINNRGVAERVERINARREANGLPTFDASRFTRPPAAVAPPGGGQRAGGASGGPVQVQTPQDAMRLPPGTEFTTPDGRTMRVPAQ